MIRRLVPIICASVFALFHMMMVVATLFSSHGAGEGQAFIVAILDYPLVLLLDALPSGGHILYNSTVAYVWFFSIAGTVLYALVGYGAGVLLRAVATFIRRRFEKYGAI